MKRFYKEASAGASPDPDRPGFAVLLDGRPIKTPCKTTVVVESAGLAEAIAGEWAAQAEEIVPQSMPLTAMACTALDIVAPRRQESVDEVAEFGEYDLICYRAEQPPELVDRQRDVWQPLVTWAAQCFDAPLVVTQGIQPVTQPAETLAALTRAVAAHEDLRLAALGLAVKASGSLVIGLALSHGRLGAETAFRAAELDASYQIELWGEDPEDQRRRAGILAELLAAEKLFQLVEA